MGRRKKKQKFIKDLDLQPPSITLSQATKKWIGIILMLAFSLVAMLSLFNLAGTLGQYLNSAMGLAFGISKWYIPIVLLFISFFLIFPARNTFRTINIIGLIVFIFAFNALLHLALYTDIMIDAASEEKGGGYVGAFLAMLSYRLLGYWGALVVLAAFAIIGFIMLFEDYFVSLINHKDYEPNEELDQENEVPTESASLIASLKNMFSRKQKIISYDSFDNDPQHIDYEGEEEDDPDDVIFEHKELTTKKAAPEENEDEKAFSASVSKFKHTKIDLPIDLLDSKTTKPNGGDLKNNSSIIFKTFKNFGIPVEMGDAQVGPTVTQYTLKPAEGVRLSKITSLSDNLALALAAHPIRIEAPIPGKSLVGIEVPNQTAASVPLAGILLSDEFKQRPSNLSISLGRDVMGKPWVYPLDKMPHLLIAGATGSGKSVCINTLILSLLFQNGPGELKFIMVDPKRVELPVYNGIPHLLTPVITDVKKTVNALRWAIKEMERRFDVLSTLGYRNIQSHNAEVEDKLPYIVIVIDELADIMSTVGQEAEAAIVRLAQMARAVGIHLVLATQRPSVDVITGTIKANITFRIAFSVASLMDSRTILDMGGAEKLLGRGDMLYISAEMSKPKRLQGAFASDQEIKKVIEYLKQQAEPEYVEEIVEKQTGALSGVIGGEGDDGDSDPLLQEAKDVIVRARKASASLLQRRLRIGYARAARILDLLEEQGVIGPGDGAKPRDVLITSFDNTGDDIQDFEGDIENDNDDADRPILNEIK